MSKFKAMLSQKELRDGERYSQRDISRLTGLSAPVVSRWMNDEIEGAQLSTVRKLCEWFECDVGDLLTIKREKEPA